MPIPLGVLAVAGAGAGPVGAGNAYEWLETQVLTGTQASVTFSNLNSSYGATYQHLQLRITARSSHTAITSPRIRLNGDSTAIYDFHDLRGTGSSMLSQAGTNNQSMYLGDILGTNNTANAFGAYLVDILDAFETTKNKTMRCLSGYAADSRQIDLTSSQWRNTAAVTSIQVLLDSGSYVSGSRFSLYGMKG